MTLLRTQPDIVEAYRARIRELNITYATVDAISGLPEGYTAKLMSPKPMRGLGEKAIEGLNGALGIAFAVTVDPEQVKRVSGRWTKRRRAIDKKKQCVKQAASLVCVKREDITENIEQLGGFALMQILGKAGGIASGKTRRAKAMRRRAVQRVRAHAARLRWSKAKA